VLGDTRISFFVRYDIVKCGSKAGTSQATGGGGSLVNQVADARRIVDSALAGDFSFFLLIKFTSYFLQPQHTRASHRHPTSLLTRIYATKSTN
jgi:hypothetical protein